MDHIINSLSNTEKKIQDTLMVMRANKQWYDKLSRIDIRNEIVDSVDTRVVEAARQDRIDIYSDLCVQLCLS